MALKLLIMAKQNATLNARYWPKAAIGSDSIRAKCTRKWYKITPIVQGVGIMLYKHQRFF